jgi:hypothetical protein
MLFLFEKEISQVLFQFQINSMSYSLETKTELVILMAIITSIYQKCLATGSIQNISSTRRPLTIRKDKIGEVEQVLEMKSANNVRNVTRKVNVSKSQAHRIIHDITGFKPHMMYDVKRANNRFILL